MGNHEECYESLKITTTKNVHIFQTLIDELVIRQRCMVTCGRNNCITVCINENKYYALKQLKSIIHYPIGNLPDTSLRKIDELVFPGLRLTTANESTSIYMGWIEVRLALETSNARIPEVHVSYLVTTG